jgi:hypothetical protein
MSNVISFDDQAHEEDKFNSWRMMNVIHDQTGGEPFELKDQYGYVFGIIHEGQYFVRLEQTKEGINLEELGIDHE